MPRAAAGRAALAQVQSALDTGNPFDTALAELTETYNEANDRDVTLSFANEVRDGLNVVKRVLGESIDSLEDKVDASGERLAEAEARLTALEESVAKLEAAPAALPGWVAPVLGVLALGAGAALALHFTS